MKPEAPLRNKKAGEIVSRAGKIIKDKRLLMKVVTSPKLLLNARKLLAELCVRCRGLTVKKVMQGKAMDKEGYCKGCQDIFNKYEEKLGG